MDCGKRDLRFPTPDPDLDDGPRQRRINLLDDAFVEPGVDLAQQRLALPRPEVGLDLNLVLFEGNAHAGNSTTAGLAGKVRREESE